MNNSFAEDIVKRALKNGCDAAEVFIKNVKGISAEAKDGKVEALKASQDYGLALKVIKDQRLGFAFTTTTDDIDKVLNEAVEAARWTAVDEYAGIPDFMPSGDVSIFDEKIKSLSEDDVIKEAMRLEESALAFDKRIKKVRKAEASARIGSTVIVNSKGVNVSYESTYYSAHLTTLAQDGKDSQMGWDFAGSRRMSDIDLNSVGRNASKRAIELLGSRKISTVKAPVIFDPSVAVDFLDILSSSMSAEAVQKNRSFLSGKTGQRVVSELVDIIDDGTMQWGSGTKPVDDEGVPSENKAIVSKGVLNGYFHNTYSARKAGTRSTGNAVRGSFKSLPGIGITNLYIKREKEQKSKVKSQKSEQENKLVKSLSKGILILGAMGVHTANPISGDFSIGISGLWIENGEALYPVKEAVISGNILELFRKIEGIGDNLTFFGNIGSPSLLIGEMDISA